MKHEAGFVEAVRRLYDERSDLEEGQRVLIEKLFREWMHTRDYDGTDRMENEDAKNKSWIRWLEAKEKSDFSVFSDAFSPSRRIRDGSR